MVDFLNWGGHSFVQAVFAQRMLGNICGADAAPARTVTLVDSRVALKLTVVFVCLFGVERAEPVAG